MGLPQHTHEMTWRCVAIVGFDALFFCKIVARWVYLYTRMRWHGDALLFRIWRFVLLKNSYKMGLPLHSREMMTRRCVAIVGFDALFFCKIVARWVYLHTRLIRHGAALLYHRVFSRSRNHRFKEAHTGTKRRLKQPSATSQPGWHATKTRHTTWTKTLEKMQQH